MDNFDNFRKLLIDKEKTLESCASAVKMTSHGLRKGIRHRTLSNDRIFTLTQFLGMYQGSLSDILCPTTKGAKASDIATRYDHEPLPPLAMTHGEFLDWLYAERETLRDMLQAHTTPAKPAPDGNSSS